MNTTQKPWEHAKSGGSENDDFAAKFVESLSYDTRMYQQDIAGSIVHAQMLQSVGLITDDDLTAIKQGLTEIESEISEQGETWPGWIIELEDVHMCIEAALIEKIGEPGKKLHTGRSRNDQVAMDLKLWIADATVEMQNELEQLMLSFVELAKQQGEMPMPSYTHLQRAQPIVLGGELLAWASAFQQCEQRMVGVPSYASNPLGSGAIAGSALPLDREMTSFALNSIFPFGPTQNSIYATASRDAALDFLFGLSMIAMWLSRWAEQWIIYQTAEFNFLKIGDAYTTGSSMMPQKRNPDMLELIRGRCGNVYGNLVALLTICKGITVGYNRDLQEDKRHLFAAFDTVKNSLMMATRIVKTANFQKQHIAKDLHQGFLDATSLAEYLVTKNIPFRTAHQHVGALVRHCIENNIVQLADLSLEQMKQIASCDVFDEEVFNWLTPENVVKQYQSFGNAGLPGLKEQLALWEKEIDQWEW